MANYDMKQSQVETADARRGRPKLSILNGDQRMAHDIIEERVFDSACNLNNKVFLFTHDGQTIQIHDNF